jgi:hypothetical protein
VVVAAVVPVAISGFNSERHLSLADVVANARKVGGGPNHGFRYIQLPVRPSL